MMNVVNLNEILARYITSSSWYHKKDKTPKQDAFMPTEDPLEVSVTRHLILTQAEIWNIGKSIVRGTPRTLHGRADIEAIHVVSQNLRVIATPENNNPNHASIIDWPIQKDARKLLALQIARVAHFIPNPEIE